MRYQLCGRRRADVCLIWVSSVNRSIQAAGTVQGKIPVDPCEASEMQAQAHTQIASYLMVRTFTSPGGPA